MSEFLARPRDECERFERVHFDAAAPDTRLQALVERLMPRIRIAVVFGGDKRAEGAVITETVNTRPWKSYETVASEIASALRTLGFKHVSLLPEDMRLAERLRRERIDLVWLNTGGVQGINPMAHAPSLLEMSGVPYIGHCPLTVSTLDNKHAFKRDLTFAGIATAPFVTWHPARGRFRPKADSRFIRTFRHHWGQFIVKPVSGRASLHVHFVEDEAQLPDAVAAVGAATENPVLIEAYLPGREYCVAVGGPAFARGRQIYALDEPFVFSAVERLLKPGERIATSMDKQPITNERLRILDDDRDEEVLAEVQELARAVALNFELQALTRLDLRADVANRICVLEANPKPDLKRPSNDVTSIVCFGLGAMGMDYEDLILGQIADRIDFLLKYRRRAAPKLAALAEKLLHPEQFG
jgi:D-alanine-D-alanine ligase